MCIHCRWGAGGAHARVGDNRDQSNGQGASVEGTHSVARPQPRRLGTKASSAANGTPRKSHKCHGAHLRAAGRPAPAARAGRPPPLQRPSAGPCGAPPTTAARARRPVAAARPCRLPRRRSRRRWLRSCVRPGKQGRRRVGLLGGLESGKWLKARPGYRRLFKPCLPVQALCPQAAPASCTHLCSCLISALVTGPTRPSSLPACGWAAAPPAAPAAPAAPPAAAWGCQ